LTRGIGRGDHVGGVRFSFFYPKVDLANYFLIDYNKKKTDLETMTSKYEEEKARMNEVQEKEDKRKSRRKRFWKTAATVATVVGTIALL
jgi:hypothetical protein